MSITFWVLFLSNWIEHFALISDYQLILLTLPCLLPGEDSCQLSTASLGRSRGDEGWPWQVGPNFHRIRFRFLSQLCIHTIHLTRFNHFRSVPLLSSSIGPPLATYGSWQYNLWGRRSSFNHLITKNHWIALTRSPASSRSWPNMYPER